jgi:Xaa-Pro aminopeptidase
MKRLLSAIVLTFAVAASAFAQLSFRSTNIELRDQIRRQKLDAWIVPILEESGADCWITLTRDPNDDTANVVWSRTVQLDPIVEFIGGEGAMVPAAFIFTASGQRIAIVSASDAPAIKDTGLYKEVVTYTYDRRRGYTEFVDRLGSTVKQIDPKRIALNYSENEPVADGLSVGMKRVFDRAVGPELAGRVVSAEQIIVTLWNRRSDLEIQLIEKSSRQSAAITEEALRTIVPGVTTARGLFDYIRRRGKEEGMEPAWEEATCPTVTVGSFGLGRPPRDKVIQRGDLIVINSGFMVEGHASDLNKVAYVLKEGETQPSEGIRKLFDTCLRALRAAVATMRPGATGIEVDTAARQAVTGAGFPEYPHATGHTTGTWVHGIGVNLGPRWNQYGFKVDMKLHERDIYAVEPSVTGYVEDVKSNLRMHLQEMVIVERDGSRYLTPPVTDLLLIK